MNDLRSNTSGKGVSSMKISRREFTAMSIAGLGLPSVLRQTARSGRPVAAVLEFTEAYTRHTSGAEIMLKKAGFEVIRLTPNNSDDDISAGRMVRDFGDPAAGIARRMEQPRYTFPVGPDRRKVDLIFFGTFTNQSQVYHDYMRRYASEIPRFVDAGGVVVEMNQWARYSFMHPRFLPEGMELIREPWSDTDEVTVVVDDHPFVSAWGGARGDVLNYPNQPRRPGRFYEGRRSWQSIAGWKGMQVLLSAGGGYRKREGQFGRAAMVEGRHGKGRYLFTSMWLDKLFDEEGKPVAEGQTMDLAERFFSALKDYVIKVGKGGGAVNVPTPEISEPWIGPMLGHVDHERAIVWSRADREGNFTLRYWKKEGDPSSARQVAGRANAGNDYCIHWKVDGLDPDTSYACAITGEGRDAVENKAFTFRTAPSPGTAAKVTIAFGSCVDQNGRFSELWKQVEACGAQGMVLLGDTPYIDSTVEIQQRIKHREFLSHPGPAYLAQRIPFWGTWDDHDFGANDSDGLVHNREKTRAVFKDYRALTSYGEDDQGIYNHFRRGPIEVFVLDLRYFCETEPSFADPGKPTLLGRRQWEWLKAGLKSSTAPFKILAGGRTWDSKGTDGRADDWATYGYEREAIVDFIGSERISGVVLVGGDIHCTQVMKFDTEERIGYPLYHIVTSPMHNRLIRQYENHNHPGMLFAKAEPNTFAAITADTTVEPALLTIEVINIRGESVYRLVTGDELNVMTH